MQLFALDKDQKIISAHLAEKKTNYFCRECKSLLRLRGGSRVKNHFFHLSRSASCRQSQKSLPHLQTQGFIQKSFPKGEVLLEKQFKEIGRIADAVWEKGKIVFEVQCSPISKEEVAARNKDYQSIGYRVIWILHDSRFNQLRASLAEIFLHDLAHYFTDIDSLGNGAIYDQIDVIKGIKRTVFKKFLEVKLYPPLRMDHLKFFLDLDVPLVVKKRVTAWPLSFPGDLLNCWMRNPAGMEQIFKHTGKDQKTGFYFSRNFIVRYLIRVFYAAILNPYRMLFRAVLENLTR